MSIRMYESDYPEPFVPPQSVFDYILSGAPGISPTGWSVPDRAPQFIDAITGTMITHGGLRDSALRIAAGLRALGLQRGDTVLLMGPNSLEWIQTAYGNMAAGHVCSPANAA
jgi:acyl-CoA synthetase (AMP-forming)/AMP-acid ligase II